MLNPFVAPEFSTLDRNVFDATVKFDHWVRRAQKHVDFLGLRKSIEHLDNADVGYWTGFVRVGGRSQGEVLRVVF